MPIQEDKGCSNLPNLSFYNNLLHSKFKKDAVSITNAKNKKA